MEPGLCERVGCGEPQVCSLLIAPQRTQAWLVSPAHEAAAEGVALCGGHADRISVPFGWTLVDDRVQPKRKRRKKKTEAVPVAEESAPTLPMEPELTEEAAPEAELADGYVEPEYQFREDGAVGVDDSAAEPSDPPPDEPEDVAESEDLVESEPHLSVILGEDGDSVEDADGGEKDEVQGALWDGPEPAEEGEPNEATPMLQRAFRVVRDD